MKILKKIAGIIILLFTILLFFPAKYAFPIIFENCKKKFEDGEIGAPGYTIGFVICLGLYIVITYFLIKLSLRLVRKKKINSKAIDKIGIEE